MPRRSECWLTRIVAHKVGFEITGATDVYETEAFKPVEDQPFGYDLQFTPLKLLNTVTLD